MKLHATPMAHAKSISVYLLNVFNILLPHFVSERSLPLKDVYCTTCNGKCKPLEILPDSHCIVVTLRGEYCFSLVLFSESCMYKHDY